MSSHVSGKIIVQPLLHISRRRSQSHPPSLFTGFLDSHCSVTWEQSWEVGRHHLLICCSDHSGTCLSPSLILPVLCKQHVRDATRKDFPEREKTVLREHVGLNKHFIKEIHTMFLAKQPLPVTACPWVELPCCTVSYRPCKAKHPGSISGFEVSALVRILSRLFMQCTALLEDQGIQTWRPLREGSCPLSRPQREASTQVKGRDVQATLSRRKEGLVQWEVQWVCSGSILTIKQNTLLMPTLGGDGSCLVCSITVHLVTPITLLWMKIMGFAEAFDKKIHQASLSPHARHDINGPLEKENSLQLQDDYGNYNTQSVPINTVSRAVDQ